MTIFVGNKVLVCLRGVPGPHRGMIFGTGGAIEPHEAPRAAAIRVSLKESGVKLLASDLSYFNDYYARRNYVVFANKLPANFGPDNRHKSESLRTVSICGVPTSERQVNIIILRFVTPRVISLILILPYPSFFTHLLHASFYCESYTHSVLIPIFLVV